MTFEYHHPNYYKKMKPKETGFLFGKKVSIDISKDLKNQTWFKSDLFTENEKSALIGYWEKTNKIPTGLEHIEEEKA